MAPKGSPPHMRGKVRGYGGWWRPYGITPAHAGKSPAPAPCPTARRDHPRTCGEKFLERMDFIFQEGSPPHMRGKEKFNTSLLPWQGITPAHAGKSVQLNISAIAIRDHPRTCGEKRIAKQPQTKSLGSPPHMRGKAALSLDAVTYPGITPAHAGKS